MLASRQPALQPSCVVLFGLLSDPWKAQVPGLQPLAANIPSRSFVCVNNLYLCNQADQIFIIFIIITAEIKPRSSPPIQNVHRWAQPSLKLLVVLSSNKKDLVFLALAATSPKSRTHCHHKLTHLHKLLIKDEIVKFKLRTANEIVNA